MRRPGSVAGLEKLGRIRLSPSFFMRDMLYSEIAAFHGLQNVPDDPDLAVAAGRRLCEEVLEPLQSAFGRISIRSAYRSAEVNAYGNVNGLGCASNEANRAAHIWDQRDADGYMGATACVVVNSFIDYYEQTGHWQAMAWWVHDNLPYSDAEFFPRFAAFNVSWHERPARRISSQIVGGPKLLTKPGMANHAGRHDAEYAAFLATLGTAPAMKS